ncbi:hypothetical protein BDN67DRAFT_876144, partial [Paxillus ammoniavirescens]
PYVLRPFTEPEVNRQQAHEKVWHCKFNKRLSSIQIYVEHAFSLLKGHFPALKDLPLERNMQDMYRLMEALITLHNICIALGDAPEHIPFFDPTDPDADTDEDDIEGGNVELPFYWVEEDNNGARPAWETDEWLKETGYQQQLRILDNLIP